ncbi:hypothetical protein [Massilia sp. 9I]|uniref:hypothetical protein n=1 Tax=Massilia sp. 9I TaxID=2653152 RepID=UPI0012F0841F|nr:hypothetical protein [Massilia sp. 9I]VXB16963.1 exported hypothetical protein [Massilia sp. 9I]
MPCSRRALRLFHLKTSAAFAAFATAASAFAVPPAQPARPATVPFAFGPPRGGPCAFSDAQLPPDTIVVAAGSYTGRRLPFQIDASGHEATQFDVAVHADKPVALLLSAYEPTIWSIGWSEGTRIVAVFATGYHRQVVAGLPKGTPVITSSYEPRGACGYRYISDEAGIGWINDAARRSFGRAAIRVYTKAPDARFEILESARPLQAYVTSPDTPPESFRDRGAPLAGDAGLAQAVAQGILRPMTPADLELVRQHYRALARQANGGVIDVPPVAGAAAGAEPPVRIPDFYRGYVVLKPFVYPAGLYGAHSASFLVAKGVARPTGNPGHSLVVDLNAQTPCVGPRCRP